jgi:hypothetical protein
VRDTAIQPADGAILTPEDICDWLRQNGVDDPRADALQQRLQAVLDDFLENWAP